MSNPAAPRVPEPSSRPDQAGHPDAIPDPDAVNPFGPDAPNIRPEDPKWGPSTPEAPPPAPPPVPLDDEDFAPDET